MVFRRDSKVDAFQRQISALRHQLGGESDDAPVPDRDHHALSKQGEFVPFGVSRFPLNRIRSNFCLSRAHRQFGFETRQTRHRRRLPALTRRPASSLIQPHGMEISSRAARCTSMGGWRDH